MKSNTLKYQGYSGSIESSLEDDCLFGRILFINDSIIYEGETIPKLRIAFQEAVDNYLEYCESSDTPANKPFSGSFNVRVGSALHRLAAIRAYEEDKNLNEVVICALESYLLNEIHHTHHHKIEHTIIKFDETLSSKSMQFHDVDSSTKNASEGRVHVKFC